MRCLTLAGCSVAIASFVFAACSAFAADNVKGTATADSRYVLNEGTVYDKTTHLSWARCSVGQEWMKGGCKGAVKGLVFDDFMKQQNGLWRIPTKDELASLVDQTRKNRKQWPTIDTVAFPDMSRENPWYWTSTPIRNLVVWGVDFHDGGVNDGGVNDKAGEKFNRRTTGAVRLVRSGK